MIDPIFIKHWSSRVSQFVYNYQIHFDNPMYLLWPDGVRHDDVLLFLSDAPPYVKKVCTTIKALYSKMTHVICIARGLRRLTENIRSHIPRVDELVAKGQQVFLKTPSRVLLFKTEALPPAPVLTC
ncbi:Hypothetical protein CINCED_3A008855 [Cinara cedri]|uniref:Uncharacterized protein n=1 Tax=Cinara cedri TaxID=506608 RepID=A0A5E4NPF4_9HEMI|nr:Hypothetical protein CINCED_3A008855 [Cinara cedri]